MPSTPCPTCGRRDFADDSYMKSHHSLVHGESIAGFTTTCTECGDTVVKVQKKHAEGNSFCNKSCEAKWRSRKTGEDSFRWEGGVEERECPTCGKIHAPDQDHRYRETCSDECLSEYRSKLTEGEGNPNWSGGYDNYYGKKWKEVRDKIRLKDDNTCQVCEFTTDERFIPVHHIIPVSEFDELDDAHYEANLAQVCRTCHPTVEAMTVAEQTDALGIERVQEIMQDV